MKKGVNYNCHKLGGVTAFALTGIYTYQNGILDTYSCHVEIIPLKFSYQSYIIPLFLLFIFSYYSSTLPDIDHPISRLGKKYPHISQYMNTQFGHRGVTHYPITLLGLGCILYLIGQIMIQPYRILWMWGSIGFVVGYASQILLDTLNSSGIVWLMPFSKVRVKIPTGIRIKNKKGKKRVCWRYLEGNRTHDKMIIIVICCLLIFLLTKG